MGHQLTDLCEHSPSRLVSDAGFPLQLLGGYASAGRSHKERRVEPSLERRPRLVEDGVRRGGDVGAAEFARVDLATFNAVMVGHAVTLSAMNAVGPTGLLDELKARIFVGELLLEVLNRVLFHASILHGSIRVVKG